MGQDLSVAEPGLAIEPAMSSDAAAAASVGECADMPDAKKAVAAPPPECFFVIDRTLAVITNNFHGEPIEPTSANKLKVLKQYLHDRGQLLHCAFDVPAGMKLLDRESRGRDQVGKGPTYIRSALRSFDEHRGWDGISPELFTHQIAVGVAHYVHVNKAAFVGKFVPDGDVIELGMCQDGEAERIDTPQAAARFLATVTKGLFTTACKLDSPQAKETAQRVLRALSAPYSRTTHVEHCVLMLGAMDMMKVFVKYNNVTACGIPHFRIRGSLADWRDLLERINSLGRDLHLSWWLNLLVPVVDKIIETIELQQAGRLLGDKLVSFWRSFVQHESHSGRSYLRGWANLLAGPYVMRKTGTFAPINEYIDSPEKQDRGEQALPDGFVDGVAYITVQYMFEAAGRPIQAVPFKDGGSSRQGATAVEERFFQYGVMGEGYDVERNLLRPLLGFAVLKGTPEPPKPKLLTK